MPVPGRALSHGDPDGCGRADFPRTQQLSSQGCSGSVSIGIPWALLRPPLVSCITYTELPTGKPTRHSRRATRGVRKEEREAKGSDPAERQPGPGKDLHQQHWIREDHRHRKLRSDLYPKKLPALEVLAKFAKSPPGHLGLGRTRRLGDDSRRALSRLWTVLYPRCTPATPRKHSSRRPNLEGLTLFENVPTEGYPTLTTAGAP